MNGRRMRTVVSVAALLLTGAATGGSRVARTGEIYRVWLDGRRIDLSHSPNRADDVVPTVSPDGKRVAFVEDGYLSVVGTDGRGLQRLSSVLRGDQSFDAQIAWSPDSTRIVIADSYAPATLYLFGDGARQRVIARAPLIREPAWSPDGRVVAFRTGEVRHNEVRAVSPSGGPLWRVRGSRFVWSRSGLAAVQVHGRHGSPETVRLYNWRGRLVAMFPGRSFAWSPVGDRIASVYANRLELHTTSGRVVFRERIHGLHAGGRNGVAWIAKNRVALGNVEAPGRFPQAITVNLRTRVVRGAALRVFGTLAPNRRLVAEIVSVPRGFALSVSRIDGDRARILVRRVPCPDLVEADVQWVPDGRSVVYDFKCQPVER